MNSLLMVSYGASSIINNNFLEMHLTHNSPYELKKNQASNVSFKQLISTVEVFAVELSELPLDSI
ncbi:hypothetical protein [Dolichospermum compactum]|uniref:Uncharacterized protein n=1 Tax=Dolichospermum compactum NIES-806 TaxID=1973481 RepID=A0A1Z4V3Y4_9CYAN|nr:hypothetical protein [Dolichospermum compactum]BAZ86089.1 hypothetical protein NIES806_22960 [Dolichospermum compactum NIES-806]